MSISRAIRTKKRGLLSPVLTNFRVMFSLFRCFLSFSYFNDWQRKWMAWFLYHLKFDVFRPDTGRRKKINLNLYFQTSLWCLKRFYEGLKGLESFWSSTKKCKNKKFWLIFVLMQHSEIHEVVRVQYWNKGEHWNGFVTLERHSLPAFLCSELTTETPE